VSRSVEASPARLTTPRAQDLGLRRICNRLGLEFTLLPNGGLFALEHVERARRIMINQVLGSPIAGGLGGLWLRVAGNDGSGGSAGRARIGRSGRRGGSNRSEALTIALAGAGARARIGVTDRSFVWDGEAQGLRHRVVLELDARLSLWLWQVEISNSGDAAVRCDSILVQDLGLGDRGFLMNNEAYASQYIDHHVAEHPRVGHVLMARQNLAQDGRHPWVAHGCLSGAVAFATDLRQVTGPAYRDAGTVGPPFGTSLPSQRLQHETACSALQSPPVELAAGASAAWTFFGVYRDDHPAASSDADLAVIEEISERASTLPLPPRAPGEGQGEAQRGAARGASRRVLELAFPRRSVLQDAPPAVADSLDDPELDRRYPERKHLERFDGGILSFFTPQRTHSRHIVLRDKERRVLRRHGAVLRSGAAMLPEETALCVTCWMHGVFGAQLVLGNTSLHRLLSVSRDPYNIGRGSGMRILIDTGEGWRLLTVPSVFEIGLSDCRWVYRLRSARGTQGGSPDDSEQGGSLSPEGVTTTRTITVAVLVSADEPVAAWRVTVEGPPCRLLVFCHLALGERELEQAARVEIDAVGKRFAFRPDPDGLWGRRYPDAVYHLVTSTPGSVEAASGEELLYADGRRSSGGYVVMQTVPTRELEFAVVGSLTDPDQAASLAARYSTRLDEAAMQSGADRYWTNLTRGVQIGGAAHLSVSNASAAEAIETILPWLAHDAMVHLTVPHGLEQYSGAAWGTRDVCQGPIELLLALGHDAAAAGVLRRLFAEQYTPGGDWSQWFMLEPYSDIRDRQSAGDVIVWPLKALCDYVEATGDCAILGESLSWRREDNLQPSDTKDTLAAHVERLIATVRARFVPGTHLLRYGNGDWNDSLQPVDPSMRERMVSSWTMALLYEQLVRYSAILRHAGRTDGSAEQRLADGVREDFNRFLVRDGIVAGYAVFSPEGGGAPELLFHPSDRRTGIAYSLIPMTQAIIGGLLTPEQARQHRELIREHLSFPDGVRLLDRPIAYHGGTQTLFQRAESAAFFGREIGLMYTHAHLRYAQAMGVLGEASELWEALLVANPISVTERLAHASLRQRNTYFSSSDAAFADRYESSREWPRVRAGAVAVDGGWRMYSSGPGIYTSLLIGQVFGRRRRFGAPILEPCLPDGLQQLTLHWGAAPAHGSPPQ
jgi:1,2-beta-oligoglucan phosphorylase